MPSLQLQRTPPSEVRLRFDLIRFSNSSVIAIFGPVSTCLQSMEQNQKRKADEAAQASSAKRQKKQWRVPRQTSNTASQPQTIQPGDSGIWATCDKGREGKCIGELRDLFTVYADELYGGDITEDVGDEATGSASIESDVQNEIKELHEPNSKQLFTPIRIDVQCGEPRPLRR